MDYTMHIKAYAKINITFDILRKLENGYHEISSIFQAIDIYDMLTISKEKNGFYLTGSAVCLPNDNLVTKAKEALESFVERELPCRIHLMKNIPISAGLGGGSSDAAAAIVGLNKIYSLKLDLGQLAEIGLEAGCDIPFFIANKGTALVEGIGEKIKPFERNVSNFYVLIRPHKRISTAEMYKLYDEKGKNGTTFFDLAQEICPDTKRVYSHFSPISNECGMSGSGPTMFAGFDSCDLAIKAMETFDVDKFNGDFFICRPTMKTYELLKISI